MYSVEAEGITIVGAKNISFLASNVDGLQKKGIGATAHNISLINSVFNNTQGRSLIGLVGINSSSTLTLKNITLNNPARGALVTKFHTGMFRSFAYKAILKILFLLSLHSTQLINIYVYYYYINSKHKANKY